jgi:hypothetical protein
MVLELSLIHLDLEFDFDKWDVYKSRLKRLEGMLLDEQVAQATFMRLEISSFLLNFILRLMAVLNIVSRQDQSVVELKGEVAKWPDFHLHMLKAEVKVPMLSIPLPIKPNIER